ncbi:MAG: glutathione S-transferase family protein [Pseudomonadota bacterium]
MDDSYRLVGGLGSPYTMKVRAALRYRRIAHTFEMRNGKVREEVAHVRPQLIPMLKFPGEPDWMVDSTPILYALESHHAGRSLLPDDEASRFIAELLEDFADEWLTKAMFHYRWFYAQDREYCAGWIAADQVTPGEGAVERRREFAASIGARQVSRMALVGCTEQNKPVIEATYERVLDALEGEVGFGQFLFGTRPSIADFGLFGQLKTLADDPTPQWLMRQRAPTVSHWIRQMDDLSGISGDWHVPGHNLPTVVTRLLRVCAETYLPFLAANASALAEGSEQVDLDLLGQRYRQAPFRYQGKCRARLVAFHSQLSGGARTRVDAWLEQAGASRWLAPAS